MTATVLPLDMAREAASPTAADPAAALPPLSVVQMLKKHAIERGAEIALRQKRFGIWQPTTFAEYWLRSCHVALGFRALGLAPKGHVGIISENRIEWVLSQMGAGVLGAV
ncbi:MAG: AMP-binding protein, partial [Phreatobacter sp.]|nr:AMP-binding protein [Phreatobacter sp.]